MKKTLYILPAIIVAAGTISTDATMARRSRIRSSSSDKNTAVVYYNKAYADMQKEATDAENAGGAVISTAFGKMSCPLANKEIGQDIFKSNDKHTLVPLEENYSSPLSEWISREKLAEYNAKYGDIYFYFKQANSDTLGFAECDKQNQPGNEIIALNSQNLDNWCIKTVEESTTLLSHTAFHSGTIAVTNGENEPCDNIKSATQKPYIYWDLSRLENKAGQNLDSSAEKIKQLKEACSGVDISELKKIKNLTLTSTISSGVGAVGSITGAVTSGLANMENKKEDTNQSKANKLGMAATISSAIGGAGSATGAVTSGIATGKIKKIIDDIKKCKSFIDSL